MWMKKSIVFHEEKTFENGQKCTKNEYLGESTYMNQMLCAV